MDDLQNDTPQSATEPTQAPVSPVPPSPVVTEEPEEIREEEETPVFEEPEKKRGISLSFLKPVALFVVLFLVGFWLSGFIRQYINAPKTTTATPSPTPTVSLLSESELTATSSLSAAMTGVQPTWNTYNVLVGTTKKAYPGVTFQLPPSVVAPTCDGTTCASQGTYLPGGTRLTVALRGEGQIYPDVRGKLIGDASGKTFTVKQTTVGGKPAEEFSGSFTGGTASGYAFANMRGVMISFSDTVMLEINHFTPSGITADFASDDKLFTTILETVQFPIDKGTVLLTPTATPTKAAAVTPSLTMTASASATTCTKQGTVYSMSYTDAVALAAKTPTCSQEGTLQATHICNEITGTWWIDIKSTRTGCSPACVVDVVNKTAEMNARCTGLSQ